MSIGLPGHLRPQVLARGFRSAAHVTAAISLGAAFLMVATVQVAYPELILWPALLALVPIGLMLWYVHRRQTMFATIAYLLVGSAATYWFALTVMSQFPIAATDAFVLSTMRIALLLVSGPTGIQSAVGWGAVGLALAEAAILLAGLQTGTTLAIDATSIVAFLFMFAAMVTIRTSLRRSRAALPNLNRAVRDQELAEVRHRIEAKSAALMHDTVLNHLTAIANAPDGPLPPALETQVERDLAALVGGDWLSDDSSDGTGEDGADWQGSTLQAAIEEARRLGLQVDVSGDLSAVGRLDSERSRALALAAKQCLINVHRHAGTGHADVVVYGSESDVSVMVIDGGNGFAVDETAPDRLGIRQSVRRRLELAGGGAQLWSTPGHGTSVLLRVPAGSRAGRA